MSIIRKLLKSITPGDLLPGISELLIKLKQNRIQTALASASRNAPEVIRRLGIEDSFDVIMDAAAVERGKPDPEIFVTAAEKMGLYPEQCAGVEDAAAGVESIRAAGIFSVGVGPAAEDADWAVPDTGGVVYERLVERFCSR